MAQAPKKTPSKFVDVCRVCGDSFSSIKNKHKLLMGHDSSVRRDYTSALEDITGRVTAGDGLPNAVCGSCRSLLRRYGRSKADMERIGSFVREKANARPMVKICAPTTPSQQLKREPVPPEDVRTSSPAAQSLFQKDEPKGTESIDDECPVTLPFDDMPTGSINAEQHSAVDSKPGPQQTQRITKVVVINEESTHCRILTGPLEKIATCLQNNHTNRLPKLVMDIPELENIAIKQVLKRVDKECQKMTSEKVNSILKKTTLSDLKQFSWEKVLDEWKKMAPTFLQFLESASTVSTQLTGNKWKKSARAKICTMAMAGASLLRARSKFMSAPMYVNALVMQHGGAKKRCYDRFGRIGICVTRKSCLRKLKTISGSWDKKYLQWKRNVCGARSLMMDEQCPDNQTAQSFQREDSVQHDQQTAPDEESCPGITFDVSEFTFSTDEENTCSNEEEENTCSNEEEEEEEDILDDSDSDWEKEDCDILESDDSDQLESDNSDESDLTLNSEWPKSVRQLCPECGDFFFSGDTHTCEYKIKPFSCNICGKRCVDERSLKTHSNIHKESYEHPCKFCMAPFKTRLDKLAHERAHIPSAKPYGCPDCSLTFSKLPARNLHLKDHRGPKIFSCPHCALEFPAVHYMERHIVVHTGMKQFVCQFCSRSFNQPGHLKSHLRVHTGEKPFQCQHCDKSFNHNVSLKSHIMRYHKGASDSEPRGHMKRIKKTNIRSSGRPKGRPKRNAATGEMNSISAVREEALDPITAAEPSEEGHLRRASSKDIESDWSERDPTSELAKEDEAKESKAVRKSKRKASQRSKTFYIAEKDFESDLDSNPAKKRHVVKSQDTGGCKGRPRNNPVV